MAAAIPAIAAAGTLAGGAAGILQATKKGPSSVSSPAGAGGGQLPQAPGIQQGLAPLSQPLAVQQPQMSAVKPGGSLLDLLSSIQGGR